MTTTDAHKRAKDYDPLRADWSIMVCHRNGAISLLRSLTLCEAEQMYERLDPFYGVYMDGHHATGNGNGVNWREVFGPTGWDAADAFAWRRWPKRAPREASDDRS